jgi:hypothetical protein
MSFLRYIAARLRADRDAQWRLEVAAYCAIMAVIIGYGVRMGLLYDVPAKPTKEAAP